MLVYIALIVLLLAFLGAIFHPIALLLIASPWQTTGFLQFLLAAQLFLANLFGWGLLVLLLVMIVIIFRARLARGKAPTRADRVTSGLPSMLGTPLAPMKVAVAITAYNEAQAIAKVVEDYRAQEGVVEVIVIDNNSRDNTAAIATAAGARVVTETRQGYGYACMRGLQEAFNVPGVEGIVLTEGDGTFVGADLQKFQAYIYQADMVIGTRVAPGLVERESQMDPFFIWGNIAVSMLLRLRFWDTQFLGAAHLSDVGCTLRAIRRQALERILPDLVVGGSHFSLHMMVVALERGLSVVEIPVTFRKRIGESKVASRSIWSGLKVGLAMIWHILVYRTRGASIPAERPRAG